MNLLNTIANLSALAAGLMALVLAVIAVIIKWGDFQREDFVLDMHPNQVARLYTATSLVLTTEGIISSISSLPVYYGIDLGVIGFFLMMGALLSATIDRKPATAALCAAVCTAFGMITAHLMVTSDRADGATDSLHTSLQLEQVMTALFIGFTVLAAALAITRIVRDHLAHRQHLAAVRDRRAQHDAKMDANL